MARGGYGYPEPRERSRGRSISGATEEVGFGAVSSWAILSCFHAYPHRLRKTFGSEPFGSDGYPEPGASRTNEATKRRFRPFEHFVVVVGGGDRDASGRETAFRPFHGGAEAPERPKKPCSEELAGRRRPRGRHLGPEQVLGDRDEEQKEARDEEGLEELVVGLDEAGHLSQEGIVVVLVGVGIEKGLVEEPVDLVQELPPWIVVVVVAAAATTAGGAASRGRGGIPLEHVVDGHLRLVRRVVVVVLIVVVAGGGGVVLGRGRGVEGRGKRRGAC